MLGLSSNNNRSDRCRETGSKRHQSVFSAIALCTTLSVIAPAATPLDFEQFTDGTQITNQIAGLQLTNTTLITAGISFNELESPPHSGVNVAFGDGGLISRTFSSAITDLQAYFNSSAQLTAIANLNGGFQFKISLTAAISLNDLESCTLNGNSRFYWRMNG